MPGRPPQSVSAMLIQKCVVMPTWSAAATGGSRSAKITLSTITGTHPTRHATTAPPGAPAWVTARAARGGANRPHVTKGGVTNPPAYDAEKGPDPLEWLGLSAGERILVVEKAHLRLLMWHPVPENMHEHARMHVDVENRIAMSEPPGIEETLARLVKAGVDRHAAVHALGSVVEGLTRAAMQNGNAFDAAACTKRLADLDPDDWRVAEKDKGKRPLPRRSPRKR